MNFQSGFIGIVVICVFVENFCFVLIENNGVVELHFATFCRFAVAGGMNNPKNVLFTY